MAGRSEPATAALADVIDDAKGGDPLAPVTVIVSDHSLGVALRRRLAATSVTSDTTGLAAVDFGAVEGGAVAVADQIATAPIIGEKRAMAPGRR